MMKRMMVGLMVGMALSWACVAAEISETLPNGVKLTADYRTAAAPNAPALLILHGFLVTHHFPTVQALAAEFSAKGYRVLAPSLSLGMSGRRAGLACDAIHTHTEAQDVAEIGFWVDWLARQGTGPIVLVGHSFGGAQLLDYMTLSPNPRVAGLVAMSMSYVGAQGETLEPLEFTRAQSMRAAKDAALGRYNLIYCRGNYTATAESYLGYASMGRAEVLERMRANRLSLAVIMGGADQRFGADWVKNMQTVGVQVSVVPGASHFFDGTFEFDLMDALAMTLAGMKVTP